MTEADIIFFFFKQKTAYEIPILVYNVPKFTHLNVSAEVVSALSRHPNIIGMKDSLGGIEQMKAFKTIVPDTWSLIVGSALILYPALELGIRAGILALANCAPVQCCEVQ